MAGLASRLCLNKHCDLMVSSHWRLSSNGPLKDRPGVKAAVQRSSRYVAHRFSLARGVPALSASRAR